EQVELSELVALGRKHGIPVMNDLGSGTLVDLSRYGLEHEPTVPETIAAGADIVTFSGDKLLGGPQAGIIIGRRQFIEPIKENPLLRAVRVDKFTIAALEVVLKEYRDPEKAAATLPVLRMLSLPADDIRKKAVRLRRLIRKRAADAYDARSEKDYSQAGGGSLPLQQIPTWVVALISRKYSVTELDRRLRKYTPPIVGRIRKDTLVLDLRTVFDQEIPVIAEALGSLV
ncbi:MAG TPA: L-seryl-tRNA(Sec) selenium transferase, partial [Thermodesulfobacteriota bacterium]|nr:L-seryl-tRNA(Sec) selenium transferase [Thermodesulfobacteriota bacterium]